MTGATVNVADAKLIPYDGWPKVPNSAVPPVNIDMNISYALDGNAMVIYWKGLAYTPPAAGTTAPGDIRIDIVRKFNGFPLSN